MQLQLTLLNSFVFLSSFVLPSGKGLSPMADYSRKSQGSNLLQGNTALFLYSQTHADASGPTWEKHLGGSLGQFSNFHSSR